LGLPEIGWILEKESGSEKIPSESNEVTHLPPITLNCRIKKHHSYEPSRYAFHHPAGDEKISRIAEKYNVPAARVHLAWLLHRSPWILPIPGTSRLAHLHDNLAARNLRLTPEDMTCLG
jgi:hypothetical protein